MTSASSSLLNRIQNEHVLLLKYLALQWDSLLIAATTAAVTAAAFSTLTLSLATSKGLTRRGIPRKLSTQQPYFEGRAMGGIRAQCT
eukprot:20554-Heterococcus_DN1.PRE.3